MNQGWLGRAIAEALNIKTAGVFNISGGYCSWRQLIETVNKYSGGKGRLTVGSNDYNNKLDCSLPQSRSYVDCSAFMKLTGFKPKQTLDELIEKFVKNRGKK